MLDDEPRDRSRRSGLRAVHGRVHRGHGAGAGPRGRGPRAVHRARIGGSGVARRPAARASPEPPYFQPPPDAIDDAAPLLTALIGLVLGIVLGSALAQSAQPQLPPYPLPPPPALYAPYTGQIPMGQGPLSWQLSFVPFAPLSSGAGAVPFAPGSSGGVTAARQPATQALSQWQQFVQEQQRALLEANTNLLSLRSALSQAQAQLDSPGKAQAVLAAQQQVEAAERQLNQLQLRQQSDRNQYRANLQSTFACRATSGGRDGVDDKSMTSLTGAAASMPVRGSRGLGVPWLARTGLRDRRRTPMISTCRETMNLFLATCVVLAGHGAALAQAVPLTPPGTAPVQISQPGSREERVGSSPSSSLAGNGRGHLRHSRLGRGG